MKRRFSPLRSSTPAIVALFALLQAATPVRDSAAADPQSSASINYRERPRYPFDPQRLKRRPAINGMIADNEWDALYTVSAAPANGTVYVNWDDEYLYLAARTDGPAWVVFDVDGNGDGWLRGADNLEITVSPQTDGAIPTLSARILDAASGKDAPIWNERAVDPKSIQIGAKVIGTVHVVELAVPKGIAGITPRADASMGVRGDFLPASGQAAPTQPYEPHLLLDVRLVESLVVTAPGITPRLSLDDPKLIPGQKLQATLELVSQSEEKKIKAVNWKGEGGAVDLLNTVREVNLPPAAARKPLKVRYSSTLPNSAIPGFYQLTAVADFEDGSAAASTASFSVVEPFVVQFMPNPDSVTVAGQTKFKVQLEVQSAVPGLTRGDAELEAPADWVVEGRRKKGFDVLREDSTVRVPFYITLPPSAAAGDYVLHSTVTWKQRTWKVHKNIRVTRSGAPESPKEKANP